MTPAGAEFVRRYRALERRAATAVAEQLQPLLRPVAARKRTPG